MVESHERPELNTECKICSETKLRDIQIAQVRNLSQNDMIHKILQGLDLGRKEGAQLRSGLVDVRRDGIFTADCSCKKYSKPGRPVAAAAAPPPSLVKYANVFRDQEERLCFWSSPLPCRRRDSASLESRDDFVFVLPRLPGF